MGKRKSSSRRCYTSCITTIVNIHDNQHHGEDKNGNQNT